MSPNTTPSAPMTSATWPPSFCGRAGDDTGLLMRDVECSGCGAVAKQFRPGRRNQLALPHWTNAEKVFTLSAYDSRLEGREDLHGHPLSQGRRHREGDDQPSRKAQRVPPAHGDG